MIKKNSVVTMAYCLKNEKGIELDRTDKSSPYTFCTDQVK